MGIPSGTFRYIQENEAMTAFMENEQTIANEQTAPFCIDSEERANWLLRKLANIESEKQRVQAQAAAICKQLEQDANGLRFLYSAQLEAFARQTLAAKGSRRRSLILLQGTCAFRAVPPSVKITDVSAALTYARQNAPEAIRTVESLDTTHYRQFAETALQDGELLPGVEYCPAREAFRITFGNVRELDESA